ncbi:hypothetical protein COCVIDRAFT_108786 [Bipolaris victoriae FI3]|uniref:Uncharacterized protein n=1 Tax=Bipolaris victoriae (strain FI3) TaxID=930091 RepID=W7EGR5_BIPV3|nr:hypothetical protein COCVIDRAFT_108786 [Bipolaris victoriae FI3]
MAHRLSDICPSLTARMRRCLILVGKLRRNTAASVQMIARPASQRSMLASVGLGRLPTAERWNRVHSI